jgi:2-iminobutanoate/2-iminopropanoate deaminase
MKKIINTPNAPAPIGSYNQAILSNNVLYLSGQIPLDPSSMKLIEGSLEDETTRVMENLKAV